jgi:hypothetical protein
MRISTESNLLVNLTKLYLDRGLFLRMKETNVVMAEMEAGIT